MKRFTRATYTGEGSYLVFLLGQFNPALNNGNLNADHAVFDGIPYDVSSGFKLKFSQDI